jgi:hypothetical protein
LGEIAAALDTEESGGGVPEWEKSEAIARGGYTDARRRKAKTPADRAQLEDEWLPLVECQPCARVPPGAGRRPGLALGGAPGRHKHQEEDYQEDNVNAGGHTAEEAPSKGSKREKAEQKLNTANTTIRRLRLTPGQLVIGKPVSVLLAVSV